MSKTVKILYFARLREQLGQGDERIDLPEGVVDVAALILLLQHRGTPWETIFSDHKQLMISVNQQMARTNTPISTGDEVAFFPPVTGG